MPDTDRKLIRTMIAGDASAEQAFVRRWHPKIGQWISRVVGENDAGDYAQEVWVHLASNQWRALKGWSGLDSETGEPFSLSGYLWQITRNKVVDLLKKEGKRPPAGLESFDISDDLSSLGTNPGHSADITFIEAAFDDCSQHFKRRDKRLILFWLEGHEDEHTSRILQMTANNVRQRRHYLLKILRDCLSEKLPEYFNAT